MNEIWCELYRPQKLEDVVSLPQGLKEIITPAMPHLLFVGGAGGGKTSVAKVAVRMLYADCLTLNASEERGIDTIREKVKQFASTTSMNNKLKVIFLDEADMLTKESQTALRNIMETYSKYTRFILTANYANKIISPIQSRCSVFEFTQPEKLSIFSRCQSILQAQGIKYEATDLKKIVDSCYPDIRKTINALQRSSTNGVLQPKLLSDEAAEYFQLIQAKKFPEIRRKLVQEAPDLISLLLDLEEQIFNSSLDAKIKSALIWEIGECNRGFFNDAMPRISFEFMVLKMLKVLA